jgi:hypothetical protein
MIPNGPVIETVPDEVIYSTQSPPKHTDWLIVNLKKVSEGGFIPDAEFNWLDAVKQSTASFLMQLSHKLYVLGTIERGSGKSIIKNLSTDASIPIPALSRVSNISFVKKSGNPIVRAAYILGLLERVFVDYTIIEEDTLSIPVSEILLANTSINLLVDEGIVDVVIEYVEDINNIAQSVGKEFIPNITGNGLYCEYQNMVIKGFYKQFNLTGNSNIFYFNSISQDAVNGAVCVNASGNADIDVEVVTFTNCKKAIDLLAASTGKFDIMNNIFENPVGETAIVYTPATYVLYSYNSINGNKWNNVGSFYSGFDFTRTDLRDANVFVRNNLGQEDKKPHFKINVVANTTGTTITAGGTFYKANFTNGDTYTCKFTLTNNKALYQTDNKSDVVLFVSGSVKNSANRDITITIRKNGVVSNISPVTVKPAGANTLTSFSFAAYVPDMAKADYVEIFVMSANNNDVITISDLTLFGQAQ